MKILYKSKLIILFYLTLYICVFLSVNYSVSSCKMDLIDVPYNLMPEYLTFAINNKNNSEELKQFLLESSFKDIVVIAENEEKKEIGIYDPIMYYYLRSTKVVSPKELRYFSNDDYKERNNVGICTYGCDIWNNEDLERISKKNDLEIIHCFANSPLSENGALIVKNLFAMNLDEKTKLYFGSYHQDTLSLLEKELVKLGYEKEFKIEIADIKVGIFESMKYVGQSIYIFYLHFATLTLILFSAIITYVYETKMKKHFIIHYVYGCPLTDSIKNTIKVLSLTIVSGCILITGILSLIIANHIYLSLENIICLLFLYACLVFINFTINFMAIYKFNNRGKRIW